MTSYNDRFSSSTVQSAYPSYTAITITGNTSLSWPIQFQNVNDIVSQWLDVTPNAGGYTVTLPTALNTVSVGQIFVINNPSAHNFTLNTFSSGSSYPINAGTTWQFILISNSTADGLWRVVPYAGGVTAITSIALATGTNNITIGAVPANPITSAGTFTINLARDLAAVAGLANTNGIMYRTGNSAAPVWSGINVQAGANMTITPPAIPATPYYSVALATTLAGLTQITVGNLTFNGSTITNTAGALTLTGSSFNILGNLGLKLFNAANSFSTTILPGAVTANTSYTLPITPPTVNQILTATAVAGSDVTLGFSTPSAGTVTRVGTGVGLTGGDIVTTGNINVLINSFCQGRLTLTSGVPVTTNDVTAATNIYWTPYTGNYVALYTNAAWKLYTFTERTLVVPNVANTAHDIFLYDNAGTLTLEAVAWTNDTTRANALIYQDGVLCKQGDLGKRFLGSFKTLAAGQTEDSDANRILVNYYGRVTKRLRKGYNATTWPYSVYGSFRQMNASTANQVGVFSLGEDAIELTIQVSSKSNGTNISYNIGVGESVTNAAAASGSHANVSATSGPVGEVCIYKNTLAPGYYFLAALEQLTGNTDTVTVSTTANGPAMYMEGLIRV